MKRMKNENLMSYGGHLEVLRQMLFRILGITFVLSCLIFCFKTQTFEILLGATDSSFITYSLVESFINHFSPGFRFEPFEIDLIATDLSSQFVSHIALSVYLGALCSSPLIIYELFRFISPALLENERRYSTKIFVSIYSLFLIGILFSYYILFPISLRFLGTYSIADKVQTMVTLDSYISTFTSISLIMGVVFQLPVLTFILAKMGLLQASQMKKYRKQAFIIIMLVAAIITPPDIFTIFIVTIPLYGLYVLSYIIAKRS